MPDTIRDGMGGGKLAKVNSDNQLEVMATVHDRLAFISEVKKTAFSVYGRRNFAAQDTNENILSILYNGTGKLHIHEIVFASNSASAKIEVYFDATSISGGSSITPLNLNRGSSITSNTTCLNGVSTLNGTTATANEVLDIRLNNSTFNLPLDGGIILTKGANLFILGEVAVAGDKARVMVYYYEEK